MSLPAPAPARSLLYVPGDRPGWVDKARRTAVDAIILDLEDAVAAANKAVARVGVGEVLREPLVDGGPQLWVRIDASSFEEDLAAVVGAGLHTVIVPKAEPDILRRVATCVDTLEAARGVPAGRIGLVGLLETARGIEQLSTIADSPRVRRRSIGEADLAADLGVGPGPDREELAPIRSRLVVASAAAGLERPIGPVHTVVDDIDALVRTCRQQYRKGFRGRTAIHPNQVATINTEFLPADAEIASARALVASFDRAESSGVTAFTGEDGHLVDPATIRRARESVSAADLTTPGASR